MVTQTLVEVRLVVLRKAFVKRESLRARDRVVVVAWMQVDEGRVVPVPMDQVAIERISQPVTHLVKERIRAVDVKRFIERVVAAEHPVRDMHVDLTGGNRR